MRKLIFTLLITLTCSIAYSCSCADYFKLKDSDKNSFERSDYVVFAEVIKEGNEFTLFILKQLKGVISQDTIHGTALNKYGGLISNCSYYPKEKGKYLLFLFFDETLNKYTLSQCSPNRNLKMTDLSQSVPDTYSKKELIKITKRFIKNKTN